MICREILRRRNDPECNYCDKAFLIISYSCLELKDICFCSSLSKEPFYHVETSSWILSNRRDLQPSSLQIKTMRSMGKYSIQNLEWYVFFRNRCAGSREDGKIDIHTKKLLQLHILINLNYNKHFVGVLFCLQSFWTTSIHLFYFFNLLSL